MSTTIYNNIVFKNMGLALIAMSDETEEVEIPGNYPALAREVRRLMGWYDPGQRMTSRVAWRKTSVSHTTITGMLQGDRPSMDLLIKFGQGMRADVNRLLRAAEYPEIKTSTDPISYDVDPELMNMAAEALDGVPDSTARALLDDLRKKAQKAKQMTPEQAYLAANRRGAIGQRVDDDEG